MLADVGCRVDVKSRLLVNGTGTGASERCMLDLHKQQINIKFILILFSVCSFLGVMSSDKILTIMLKCDEVWSTGAFGTHSVEYGRWDFEGLDRQGYISRAKIPTIITLPYHARIRGSAYC